MDKGVRRHSKRPQMNNSPLGLSTGVRRDASDRIFEKIFPMGLQWSLNQVESGVRNAVARAAKAEKPCIDRSFWLDRSTIFSITLLILNRRCLTSA